MDTLSAVVAQLGKKYVIFIPMVQKVLIKHKISHQDYDILCARLAEVERTLAYYDFFSTKFVSGRKFEL